MITFLVMAVLFSISVAKSVLHFNHFFILKNGGWGIMLVKSKENDLDEYMEDNLGKSAETYTQK